MSEVPTAAVSDGQFDVPGLVGQLTLAEKVSFCVGSDFWHTAGVERLGIPKIMVSDGPHGLRAQMDEADHLGLSGSVPATCFRLRRRSVRRGTSRCSGRWVRHLPARLGGGVSR